MDLEHLSCLVVEDDEQARKLIVLMLEDMGVRAVCAAGDADAAKRLLAEAEEPVHLVICDWMMPGMPGTDLVRELRRTHPDLWVFMVTGRSDASSISEAKGLGINGFLAKPFRASALEEKIRALLAQMA
ncbi:MAG: response regulator [Alphaproteobacteria bacterium]